MTPRIWAQLVADWNTFDSCYATAGKYHASKKTKSRKCRFKCFANPHGKNKLCRGLRESNFLLVRTNKWESKLAFILVHHAILKFQTHSLDLFRTYQRTTVENPQPHWSYSSDFRVHCCQTAFYLRRRERKPQPLPFCCHCALGQGISSCNICKEYVQERNSCRKLRAHCLNSKSDTEWICRKWLPILFPAFCFHKLE